MKKPFHFIGILIILLFSCACSPSLSPEEEVQNFYMEYVEACKEDRMDATTKYVHFEDPFDWEMAKQTSNNSLLRTDILNIERLSDELWVIHIYYESLYVPDGNETYHFVGVLDGEYKVMRSLENIPPYLKQDLSLEQYIPTVDFISPDEVILPNCNK